MRSKPRLAKDKIETKVEPNQGLIKNQNFPKSKPGLTMDYTKTKSGLNEM